MNLHAETPTAYTVTENNAMFGPPGVQMKISRNGSKALIEHMGDMPSLTLNDLQTHQSTTWYISDPASCSHGTFSGDWGDPFEFSAGSNSELAKQNMKQTGTETMGTETIAGVAAKVMESASAAGQAKVWIDPKSGLALKVQFTAPNTTEPRTLIEISSFSLAIPPAPLFVVPPTCPAAGPPPPTEAETLSALTGGNPQDFSRAIMPPASPSKGSS